MGEELVEFLACPRRCGLRAEVVQDEQLGVADFFEALVVADRAGRVESSAQVVQQVGHHDEERHEPTVLGVVGDSAGQMGFAAAVGAGEHQPAFGLLGVFAGSLEGFLQAAAVLGGQAFALAHVEAGEVAIAQQVQRGELVLAAVVGGAAEIGRQDLELGDEFGVAEPRADAPLDLVERQVGGHHQWQLVDVAMVDDLEEFFLRPGGGVLRAEVIQDQQRRLANFFEALLETFFGRAVGEAQRIEQIGHGDENSGQTNGDGEVGDAGGEMRFAAAVAAFEHEPALHLGGEFLGLIVGRLERVGLAGWQPDAAARLEALEGQVLEFIQAADGIQPPARVQPDFIFAAYANLQLAEIGMAERQVGAHVAQAAAMRAVGVADHFWF